MEYTEIVESISVKPSIDIIPDEYECFGEDSGAKVLVYNFCTSNLSSKENVKVFKESLEEKYYDFTEHSLDKDNCLEILTDIRKRCQDNDNISGLILFFCGRCTENGELLMYDGKKTVKYQLHKIWSDFYSNECRNLKNKPKIFIFEVKIVKDVETDFKGPAAIYELTYDTPNEADILIVYHKAQDDIKDEYVSKFCKNIKKFGKFEDITNLATCVEEPGNVPMLISTLTRKFYCIPDSRRGYDHMTSELHLKIEQTLKLRVTNKPETKRKVVAKVNPKPPLKRNNPSQPGTSLGKSGISQSNKDITAAHDSRSISKKSTPETDRKHFSTAARAPGNSKITRSGMSVDTDKLGSSTSITEKKLVSEEGESTKSPIFKEPNLTGTSLAKRQTSTTTNRHRTKSTSESTQSSEKPRWKNR